MIKRFGKDVDMRNIKRDINYINQLIENSRRTAYIHLNGHTLSNRNSCILCGSKDNKDFVGIYGYHFFECLNCDSLFLKNVPNTNKLYEGIPNTAIDFYIDDELFDKRVQMIAKPKVDYIFEVANQLSFEITKWVDIGCGTGEILSLLGSRNCSAIGIESDLREVEFAREKKHLKIIEGFVDKDNEKPEIRTAIANAHVISFFNVLEHINDPKSFIDYLYNIMGTGNLLVFEVPKHPSLASFANLTSNENVYRHIIPPIHLQIFSDKGIQSLLKDKFKVLATWGFGQGFFDLLTNAMLISECDNIALYNKLVDVSNHVQKVIDEQNLSDQMIYIAQKQ